MPIEGGKLTVKRKAPKPTQNKGGDATCRDPEKSSRTDLLTSNAAPTFKPKRAAKDPHKSPPHSVDAEKGVLGSALLDAATVLPEISRELSPACFYVPAHNTIFQVLLGMFKDEQPIDLLTVTQTLRDRKLLDAVGGAVFVTELFTFVPTSANVRYYIDIVKKKFLLREMIYTGTEMVRRAYGAEDDAVPGLIERAATSIERIKRAAGGPNGAENFDCKTLNELDVKHDPDCLVGNRFLVRGGSSLWAAGSGYGKSSLALQLAIYWACGQTCFGLPVFRPLKSLIIQAENDLFDMAEQFQGAVQGISKMGDIDPVSKLDIIYKNLKIKRLVDYTGDKFLTILEEFIQIEKPDFVWIDPMFAFAGCDLMKADQVGRFLREGLFSIAKKYRVAMNVIHHIGKPSRDSKAPPSDAMATVDYQFLAFGSSDIENAFRAVIILRPVANTGVFKLVFSKRGKRAGARDTEGHVTEEIYLEHSKDGICWLQCGEPEDMGGRKVKFKAEIILPYMSVAIPIKLRVLYKVLCDEEGLTRSTFYRLFDELKKAGKVDLQSEDGWIAKPKSDAE